MFYYKGHSMLTTLPSPSAQTIRQSVPDQEDIIRRSLERSARYGVDPHLDGAPESTRLSDEHLRERINGQRVFYTLAKEQIDSLYRLLQNLICLLQCLGHGRSAVNDLQQLVVGDHDQGINTLF